MFVRIDFLLVQEVTLLIALLGAAMALYAGFCALAQRDVKRVLAYSTLSQLGYMAATAGLGMGGLAMFHHFTKRQITARARAPHTGYSTKLLLVAVF